MSKTLLYITACLLAACGGSAGSGSANTTQADSKSDNAATAREAIDTSPMAGLGCSWQAASEADLANIAFPDDAARYWVALVPVTPGNRIRIDGRFPDARYFSFNSYDLALRPTDALADTEVLAAAGEQNPFRVATVAKGGHYSAYLAFGAAPETREAGVFFAGNIGIGPLSTPNSVLVPIIYRVYVSAVGERLDGGVGLPVLSIETTNGEQGLALPTCAEPILPTLGGNLPGLGLNELLLGQDYPDELLPLPFPTAAYPPRTRVFYGLPDTTIDIIGNALPPTNQLPRESLPSTGSGGFLSNIHNAYTTSAFARQYGNLFLLRAKAPSWRGAPNIAFANEQVRYWSLCQNEFATQRYTACRIDKNTPLDSEGYFTVAVSDAAERPVFATDEDGITWLPWGPYPDGLLLYRQMLAHPDFAKAIKHVPKGEALEPTMGAFAPQVTYCRAVIFDQPGLTPRQRFDACAQDQIAAQQSTSARPK
ncbi:MAG: hypothetical protein ABIR53_00425 [Paraperlucidibaca sp.]